MTPCGEVGCPVKNARWLIYTHEGKPLGKRWGVYRNPGGGWRCKQHARERVDELNQEEIIQHKHASLEFFLGALK